MKVFGNNKFEDAFDRVMLQLEFTRKSYGDTVCHGFNMFDAGYIAGLAFSANVVNKHLGEFAKSKQRPIISNEANNQQQV